VAPGGLAGGDWPDSGEWLAGRVGERAKESQGTHPGSVCGGIGARKTGGEHGRRTRSAAVAATRCPTKLGGMWGNTRGF
jgi:hypothetical protein